jgi:hypothetical protein
MTSQPELDRILGAFLEDGTDEVADRVIDAALDEIDNTHQRRASRAPGRFSTMKLITGVAAAAAIGVLAIGGALVVVQRGQPGVGGSGPEPDASASPPVGQMTACPPGSTPDEPGPVDQARPPQDVFTAVAFDRRAGRLVVLADATDGVETWTFDVCTNTWARMHPDREPPSPGSLVYDVDSDQTIGIFRRVGNVWAYDMEANTWTEKGAAPSLVGHAAYDPLSGLIVASDTSEPIRVWSYDVEADAWTPIAQANGPDPGTGLVYDASVDRIIATGNPALLFDIRTGTWSRSGVETPNVMGAILTAPSTVAYDEAAKRTVVVGAARLAAYDATADRWEILAESADASAAIPSSMAYDSVNRRLVGPRVHGEDVLAFDTQAREWTVLLAPSEGQAAPGSE